MTCYVITRAGLGEFVVKRAGQHKTRLEAASITIEANAIFEEMHKTLKSVYKTDTIEYAIRTAWAVLESKSNGRLPDTEAARLAQFDSIGLIGVLREPVAATFSILNTEAECILNIEHFDTFLSLHREALVYRFRTGIPTTIILNAHLDMLNPPSRLSARTEQALQTFSKDASTLQFRLGKNQNRPEVDFSVDHGTFKIIGRPVSGGEWSPLIVAGGGKVTVVPDEVHDVHQTALVYRDDDDEGRDNRTIYQKYLSLLERYLALSHYDYTPMLFGGDKKDVKVGKTFARMSNRAVTKSPIG